MLMLPGLDICVTNYQTPDDLQEFLDSVDRFPPKEPFDVYVANVEPRPIDREVAHAWLGTHVRASEIDFPDNVGYGKACNSAAQAGSRNMIALFNADVVLTPGALQACYDALKSHPLWGCLGPRQVDKQGLIRAGGILGTNTHPILRGWEEDGSDGRYSDMRSDCVSVSGSAFFVRRTVWEELTECTVYQESDQNSQGAFLQTPLFFEETWACYHAKFHGYKNVYLGTTTIIHKFHQAVIKTGKTDTEKIAFRKARKMFQQTCDHHSIAHD